MRLKKDIPWNKRKQFERCIFVRIKQDLSWCCSVGSMAFTVLTMSDLSGKIKGTFDSLKCIACILLEKLIRRRIEFNDIIRICPCTWFHLFFHFFFYFENIALNGYYADTRNSLDVHTKILNLSARWNEFGIHTWDWLYMDRNKVSPFLTNRIRHFLRYRRMDLAWFGVLFNDVTN